MDNRTHCLPTRQAAQTAFNDPLARAVRTVKLLRSLLYHARQCFHIHDQPSTYQHPQPLAMQRHAHLHFDVGTNNRFAPAAPCYSTVISRLIVFIRNCFQSHLSSLARGCSRRESRATPQFRSWNRLEPIGSRTKPPHQHRMIGSRQARMHRVREKKTVGIIPCSPISMSHSSYSILISSCICFPCAGLSDVLYILILIRTKVSWGSEISGLA